MAFSIRDKALQQQDLETQNDTVKLLKVYDSMQYLSPKLRETLLLHYLPHNLDLSKDGKRVYIRDTSNRICSDTPVLSN